jgi:hypothetical protein
MLLSSTIPDILRSHSAFMGPSSPKIVMGVTGPEGEGITVL